MATLPTLTLTLHPSVERVLPWREMPTVEGPLVRFSRLSLHAYAAAAHSSSFKRSADIVRSILPCPL